MDNEDLWAEAERRFGLLRVDDLRLAALSPAQRLTLQANGSIERLSARVLRRTGSPRSPYQIALAAVLDAGHGAVLAGDSGAWLWQVPGFTFSEPVELTRERGEAKVMRDTLGIIKERRTLPDHHVTQVAGIPVLTLPVLLFQLAATEPPARFERVADSVIARSPSVLRALHTLLPELAARGRNGIVVMRSYLEHRPVGTIPPTGLERRFEHVVAGTEVSGLRRQVDLGGHEWIGRVDYLDDVSSMIIEIQSHAYHYAELDRAADRIRIDRLLAAGFNAVLQIDEDVVWYRPHRIVTAVLQARQAIKQGDPGRFVIWNDDPGLQFQMTKRDVGEDRMGA